MIFILVSSIFCCSPFAPSHSFPGCYLCMLSFVLSADTSFCFESTLFFCSQDFAQFIFIFRQSRCLVVSPKSPLFSSMAHGKFNSTIPGFLSPVRRATYGDDETLRTNSLMKHFICLGASDGAVLTSLSFSHLLLFLSNPSECQVLLVMMSIDEFLVYQEILPLQTGASPKSRYGRISEYIMYFPLVSSGRNDDV